MVSIPFNSAEEWLQLCAQCGMSWVTDPRALGPFHCNPITGNSRRLEEAAADLLSPFEERRDSGLDLDCVDYVLAVSVDAIPLASVIARRIDMDREPDATCHCTFIDPALDGEIRGGLKKGSRVLFVEDVYSEPSRVEKAAQVVLRSQGVSLKMIMAVVSFAPPQGAQAPNFRVHSLVRIERQEFVKRKPQVFNFEKCE